MALDLIVRFPDLCPTYEQLDNLIKNYLGGVGQVEKPVHPELYHWVVNLPGTMTHALASEISIPPFQGDDRPRGFEVFLDLNPTSRYMDVVTRQMDNFTNALAVGLVEAARRYWRGEREYDVD